MRGSCIESSRTIAGPTHFPFNLAITICKEAPCRIGLGFLQVSYSCVIFALPIYAVSPLPFCQEQSGPETNGSVYLICPAANPNADLVIFAHGFVSPDEPVGIPYNQLLLPDGTSIPGLIPQLGMSFAATSYPVNGLAIVEGVDDVKHLATYFKNHYGSPNRVLLTGVSEGGLVVAKAIESAPGDFSGGLAACRPVGDFRYQISYFMDVRVVFDYFFPGVIPGSAIDIPDNVRPEFHRVHNRGLCCPLRCTSLCGAGGESIEDSAVAEGYRGANWP